VADFEHPAENEADLILNTGSMSEQECLEEIVKTFQKKYPNF
jgi:hypothetical protein